MRISFLALAMLASAGAAADDSDLVIERQLSPGQIGFSLHNRSVSTLDVVLDARPVLNAVPNQPYPVELIIKAGETRSAGVFTAAGPGLMQVSESAKVFMGDPSLVPDASFPYRLPFENGLSFTVTQAPGGPLLTHNAPDSINAIDFAMPIGTKVLAARAGVVVRAIKIFGNGGFSPAFTESSNYVMIDHGDGSFAIYGHLQRYTSQVSPGMYVQAGTVIGLSGNSGFSSGPHLHFGVQRNIGHGYASLPVIFYNNALGRFSARRGQIVTADYGQPWPTDTLTIGPDGNFHDSRRSLKDCVGESKVMDNHVIDCMSGK